jgi:hypothetical protein
MANGSGVVASKQSDIPSFFPFRGFLPAFTRLCPARANDFSERRASVGSRCTSQIARIRESSISTSAEKVEDDERATQLDE